jgi:hypothetical protein
MDLIRQGIIGAYFPQLGFYYKAFQALSPPDPDISTRRNQSLRVPRWVPSAQNVGWRDRGAEGTGWEVTDPLDAVNASHRAGWDFAGTGELDVGYQVIWKVDGFAVGLVVFQREFIGTSIKLAQIVDAGVGWAGSPSRSLCLSLDHEESDKPDEENQEANLQ